MACLSILLNFDIFNMTHVKLMYKFQLIDLYWFTCSDRGMLQDDSIVDEADVFGWSGGSGSLPP